MDSAKTTRDEGTFWAPEDRGWLWYNDTIETHAWAIRALQEIAPKDPRLPGLVQWIFLNKKLNHWKSTRGTAEVLYSLARYLKATGQLAVREAVTVEAGHQTTTFVFEPDRFTGKKNQVVIPGAKLDASAATVVASKESPGLAFVSATWHFSTEQLPEEARGDLFRVERRYFRRERKGDETVLVPLKDGATIAVGDELEVQVSVTARAQAEYVHLRDPRPAGFEPVETASGWRYQTGLAAYQEIRDSGTNFFFEWLPAGRVHPEAPPARRDRRHLPRRPGRAAVDVRPGVHRLLDRRADRDRAGRRVGAAARVRAPTNAWCRRSRRRRRRAGAAGARAARCRRRASRPAARCRPW